MEEIKRPCSDCSNEFTITLGEQKFYKEKDFELPKRCKPCRNKRKFERQQVGG